MPIPVIIFSRDQAIVRNIDWKSVLKAKNITFWNFFLQTKNTLTDGSQALLQDMAFLPKIWAASIWWKEEYTKIRKLCGSTQN